MAGNIKETKLIMGMPVKVEIRDEKPDNEAGEAIKRVFAYFEEIDKKFSTYKEDSEISKINRGEIGIEEASSEMKKIFVLSEQTKNLSSGYFDIIKPDGSIDPSGLVKGWAIWNAAKLLQEKGFWNFFIDAGGDVQTSSAEQKWRVGIRSPFDRDEIVKVLEIGNEGVATSGTYIRGQHIYNPHNPDSVLDEVVSVTVIGENVYEADRFATAAFAMGIEGIKFIEALPGFEAYQINKSRNAVMTSGFGKYVAKG